MGRWQPPTLLEPLVKLMEGRAVAQAVSRWLPTAAARVRVRAPFRGLHYI
jgi:hypothetical protein